MLGFFLRGIAYTVFAILCLLRSIAIMKNKDNKTYGLNKYGEFTILQHGERYYKVKLALYIGGFVAFLFYDVINVVWFFVCYGSELGF